MKSQSSDYLKLVSWTWPPYSPDLNQIEHLGNVVKQEIYFINEHPKTLQQLCDAIMLKWTEIPEKSSQHLIESSSEGKKGSNFIRARCT